MLKEAKVSSKIMKDDLTYLINIIRPELIAQLVIDYRDNDLVSAPDFLQYNNLKYLMDLKNKETKINLIVQYQDIGDLKSFDTGDLLTVLIADSRGTKMKLLLWDNQSLELREKKISSGDVVYIKGANTRLDKDGKIILNLGNYGEMSKIVELIRTQIFDPKGERVPYLKIEEINTSTELASIHGNISFISPIIYIEKFGKKIELAKISLKDNTGSFEVVFWGNNAKRASKYGIGEEIRLTNIKMKYNDYSKSMGGSFTKNSVISRVESNLNLAKTPPKYNKKDTSLKGTVISIPQVKQLATSSTADAIYSFSLKDRGKNDYLIIVMKENFSDLLEFITVGVEIVLDRVNIRSSANLDYKYEVYVTPKSDLQLILD